MGEPIDDFYRWELYQEERLNRRPICAICGEPIQEETMYMFNVPGYSLSAPITICPQCMDDALTYIEEE